MEVCGGTPRAPSLRGERQGATRRADGVQGGAAVDVPRAGQARYRGRVAAQDRRPGGRRPTCGRGGRRGARSLRARAWLSEEDFRRLRSWAESLARPPHGLAAERIWRAYERAGVAVPDPRPPRAPKGPADLVALVRYEAGLEPRPRPCRDQVFDRLGAWLDHQKRRGRSFDSDQVWWMEHIPNGTAAGGHFAAASLDAVPFTVRGARRVSCAPSGSTGSRVQSAC
ncbi:type I restriction-modification enzyme R subunit C-terminal domain-containing protein [Streptomyces sp. NPDC001674]|uniref:type I restriction-modification enzyme R subunit C-terminal domain-containing protein n=1 Tax=Streptomyces sp. NPDC001674 TaxID=3154394 RepID=UPI00331A9674